MKITNQQRGTSEVKDPVNQEDQENQSTKRTYRTSEPTELANQQNQSINRNIETPNLVNQHN